MRHDPARPSAAPLPAGQTASNTHPGSVPCPQGNAASQGDSVFFPLRQDGTRRRKDNRPDTFKPRGAARTLPRRGKQRRARGSRARGSRARGSRARGSRARGSRAWGTRPREVIPVNPTPGEPQLPEAQPPENLNPPDFRSLEAPRPVSRFRRLPRWDIEPRTRPLSVVYVRSMQDEE